MTTPYDNISDIEIIKARPAKNSVEPRRPYAFLVEPEHSAAGTIDDVATIFLTNRECPYRCLMCDLWKNTIDSRVAAGAIPAQIDYALQRLPSAQHIKLYNSGNFFDRQAIPAEDHSAIAARVCDFKTVIVENHPNLCGDDCRRFRDLLDGQLEVALGLETIHPDILPRLNKRMTLDDFQRAVEFLLTADIRVRSFILLRPPWLNEDQGVDWALRSADYAFSLGVGCCSIIPTRTGNGIMEELQASGQFESPSIHSMETVLAEGLKLQKGRVFVDLWDIERLGNCDGCLQERRDRLQQMNLSQQVLPPISGSCETQRFEEPKQ